MLRLSRPRRRVGLFPDRLTLDGSPVPGASLEQLQHIPGDDALDVVLSEHYVRYAVLPWSPDLGSEAEWRAFAEHTFASTYGSAATAWTVRMSATGRRRPRIACGMDSAVLDSLKQAPRVRSVTPALMEAFNGRRQAFSHEPGWFVLQEPGRLTMSLIANGDWQLISSRQASDDWRSALPDMLDRETVSRGATGCDRVVLHCQDQPPTRIERYRIADSVSSR